MSRRRREAGNDSLSATVERGSGELRAIAFMLSGAIEQLPDAASFDVLRAWFRQCEQRLARLADALSAEVAAPDVRALDAYTGVARRWLSPLVAGSIAVGAVSGVGTGILEAAGEDIWNGLKAAAVKAYNVIEEVQMHADVHSMAVPERYAVLDDIEANVATDRATEFVQSFTQRGGE